jgi:hypothetical protein
MTYDRSLRYLSCVGRLGWLAFVQPVVAEASMCQTTLAASIRFGYWFGSFFLTHQSSTQRRLATAEIGKNRFHVKVELCRELFSCPMDIRNNWVFPHDVMLP